jgi:hypothetical protein
MKSVDGLRSQERPNSNSQVPNSQPKPVSTYHVLLASEITVVHVRLVETFVFGKWPTPYVHGVSVGSLYTLCRQGYIILIKKEISLYLKFLK